MSHSHGHVTSRISVLIVTPDNMTAELLKTAFVRSRKNGFIVNALTGSSEAVIGALESQKPRIALICEDLQDGPQAGHKVLKKLRNSHPDTAVIMLLQTRTPGSVVTSFSGGARGVFYRSHSLKALSKCIRKVHDGQIWAGNEDLEHVMEALPHIHPLKFQNTDGTPILTRREESVVHLVVDGLKNREIAQKLNVKEHSIRNYLYRIFEKLGVSTRVELILYTFSQQDHSN
jgi:DNA-binding NarL/FixJ family response regulator